MTIAGHDPSGGAGITTDIKTFEAHGLYGLSVCTAITVQNDIAFKACHWVSTENVLSQIKILFDRFPIPVVKIGIVKSWKSLKHILDELHQLNSEVKIILDPILKASAGFNFHDGKPAERLEHIWKSCFMVTPNFEEIHALFPNQKIDETLQNMSLYTKVYLKGGHRMDKKGWDDVYHQGENILTIPPCSHKVFEKHGSGCVLSSALASNLALGKPLEKACKDAKYFTEQFLNSHESLLGIHNK